MERQFSLLNEIDDPLNLYNDILVDGERKSSYNWQTMSEAQMREQNCIVADFSGL